MAQSSVRPELVGADAVEQLLQELGVVGDLAVVLHAKADGRAVGDLAQALAGVDGEGEELVPVHFARHDVNADDVHPERLGRLDQAARALQLLLQPLVEVVGHHEGGDAAAAGGQIVLEHLDALGGGQGVFALRVEEVGAGEVQFGIDLGALGAEGFHAGPTVRLAGDLEMQIAAADRPLGFGRRGQRAD